MEPLTTANLTPVFSDVLANLAFMFTDENRGDPSPATNWLETTISYHGPTSGTLKLQCPTEFGVLLAANLLGVDAEDDDAGSKAQDAVKEFMNIVCGQFVTTIHGTEQVFDLTIPQTRELTEPPDSTGHDESLVSTLTVEGHSVQLTYAPDDEAGGQ